MTIHLISYRHSGLSLLKEIVHFFSPIKLYVPWGGTVPEYTDDKEISASYPPEEFRPDADFNRLLDECFNWACEQGEKSRKEIIKTGHTNPISNESFRHIKTILADRISDTSEKDMILRWHMLLHLANRLEENRNDANRMLEGLKKKPSPLFNNADLTENTRYPLENLRGIDPDFLINDTSIKFLLRAWHGLFNSLTDKDDMLLVIDRRIFDYLTGEWDISNNNTDLINSEIISFKSPPFKNISDSVDNITIGGDIRNIVTSDLKREEKITALKKLTSEFGSMFQTETGDNQINFSLLLFRPAEKSKEVEKDEFRKFLSGRALIFAEINA
ncbi:MAG: hypothetical protein PVG39_21875 [Desulfobacteraceae bacterium]|jgi:hypothetical protein